MKINEQRSSLPAAQTRKTRASTAYADVASKTSAGEAPSETVSIAGVPQSELTPRVLQALTRLMEEVEQLKQRLSDSETQISELSAIAFVDPLTNVANRRGFIAELNRTVANANRHGHPAALAFFDLDDMKTVNDGRGHAGGDAAIRHIAGVIRENIRENDVIGRLGGDEFGVIFNIAEVDDAKSKAAYLQRLIAETPVRDANGRFNITATVGVAPITQGATAEVALNLADAAMYDGKKARNPR